MNKRSWTEVYPQNILSHMLEPLITHPTTPERSISGEIPSWEVTYPLPAGTFEDDFPAPLVGYISSWRVIAQIESEPSTLLLLHLNFRKWNSRFIIMQKLE